MVPVLLVAGSLLLISMAPSTAADPDPSVGDLVECLDSNGNKDVFEVRESTAGENFRIWILRGILSGDVRAGWDAQIPRTHEGVDTYLTYTYTIGSGHERTTVTEVDNRAFKNAIAGTCGAILGHPQGSTFGVQIDFMGQDVEITDKDGHQIGVSITVAVKTKFSLNPVNLAGVEVDASLTGTFEFWSETSTTLHGYLKTFAQDGYSNDPLVVLKSEVEGLCGSTGVCSR